VQRTIIAGLVLVGFLAGWSGLWLATRRIVGTPAAVRKPKPTFDQAEVVSRPYSPWTAAGEEVELSWELDNTGDTTWTTDDYRFVPARDDLPVLSVPAAVLPGKHVRVKALLTAPETAGTWNVSWTLTGATRQVPGGHIDADVSVDAP
jgi:hypothetical protein